MKINKQITENRTLKNFKTMTTFLFIELYIGFAKNAFENVVIDNIC